MYGVITRPFESFLHNYQEELKIISGSEFIFESVELNFILYV